MSDDVDLFGNPRTPETMYWLGEKQISASSLRNADRKTQIEAMKTWFFGTYEDPSENTPYVGSEGGYQFIHGGPYGAQQVLTNEFSENVGEDLIEELAEEVDGYSMDWAPKDFGGYDNYLLDSITKFTEHYHAFAATLSSTRLLALENVPFPQQQHLYRLLWGIRSKVNAIPV